MSLVKDLVHRQGYLWLQGERTSEEALYLAGKLGTVLQIFNVRVRKNSSSIIESHHKMQFHIDAPAARYVIWHCREQGEIGEDILLLDLRDIHTSFTKNELELMKCARIYLPSGYIPKSEIFLHYERHPLLVEENGEFLVNFAEWINVCWPDQIIEQKFKSYVEKKKHEIVNLHLKRGDILILDNRRYMHSRTALNKETKRCHVRYLISG
jgi:Taurine catabolism dioxygenase TauD, TfdA family